MWDGDNSIDNYGADWSAGQIHGLRIYETGEQRLYYDPSLWPEIKPGVSKI